MRFAGKDLKTGEIVTGKGFAPIDDDFGYIFEKPGLDWVDRNDDSHEFRYRGNFWLVNNSSVVMMATRKQVVVND